MTINDKYSSGEIVFSRNAGDLEVTEAGSDAVSIGVYVDSVLQVEFSVMPIDGKVILRLSDILEACSAGRLMAFAMRSSVYTLPVVKITIGGLSWSHPVIFGREPSDKDIDKYDFLTRRPETCQTFADGAELAASLWSAALAGTGTMLMAEIRFAVGLPVTVTLPSPLALPSTRGSLLARICCSYSDILAAAVSAGREDEPIVGWSVWVKRTALDTSGVFVTTSGGKQNFVMRTGLHHTYIFRNTYGTFDTIYATGSKVVSSDGDVSTFINGGVESELGNAAVRYVEQNTGYISSRGYARLWLDFIRSAERYVYEDGEAHRIIVDENDAKVTEGELSSFKFKWHYADRNNDYKI